MREGRRWVFLDRECGEGRRGSLLVDCLHVAYEDESSGWNLERGSMAGRSIDPNPRSVGGPPQSKRARNHHHFATQRYSPGDESDDVLTSSSWSKSWNENGCAGDTLESSIAIVCVQSACRYCGVFAAPGIRTASSGSPESASSTRARGYKTGRFPNFHKSNSHLIYKTRPIAARLSEKQCLSIEHSGRSHARR